MRMNWTDQNLVWDPADYDGLTQVPSRDTGPGSTDFQIHFGPEELWRPDIHLYNNADGSDLAHYGSTHFLVFHTGVLPCPVCWVCSSLCRWCCGSRPPSSAPSARSTSDSGPRIPRYRLLLVLSSSSLYCQVCRLKFGSWTSHGEQIDLGLFHKMEEVTSH